MCPCKVCDKFHVCKYVRRDKQTDPQTDIMTNRLNWGQFSENVLLMLKHTLDMFIEFPG